METLLPKTTEDFSKREYWERFFQSRQNTFEWYGDFLQHSRFFTKYIRKADRALVVGCGNSDLGLMIFEKLNVGDVTNIDISETIIRQMRQKHCSRKIRAGLTYECMDVFTIEDNIKSGRMNPFSCVLDKGTLDAIHSGDNSDSDATNMFRNIDSALNLMGRYIILTLAQEHIVHSICNYFIQGSNQWLINCHQLTSNKNSTDSQDKDIFPLPVYGFVMTKLRASHGLPRVSVFPPGADEPTHVNGSPEYLSEQIKTWISQEQNWSLLRHDVNSGSQRELRFSCPRTGLTVFRGVLIQMEQTRSSLKKNKKTPKKNPTGRIEAIFLVAFGQNNNAAFQEPTRRQELCQMLNFSTLLLVFTNSRCFHNDLEEVKSKLSAALSMLDLGDAETKKAPVLSTPDSYTRWEMELPTTSATQLEIKLDCVQFRRFDLDKLLTLKRLVVPSADLRPILATNASTLSVPSVMAPRDLHLQAWIEMLCFSTGCSHVAYYGLPPIGSFSSDFSKHFQIHVVGAGADGDVQIRDAFCALYANEFDTMKCCRCDKSLIAWSNTFSEELGDGQLDLVLYDPVSPFARNYYSCFTPDRIDAMSNICTKKLSPQGWLVVLFENSTNTAASAAARPTSIGPFNRVLSYSVSDSVFADPGTCIEIFHHNSMDSLDARTELLVRLRTYKSRCYRQDVSQQHAEMWNQLDLLLEK